jgi:hypothetical protein
MQIHETNDIYVLSFHVENRDKKKSYPLIIGAKHDDTYFSIKANVGGKMIDLIQNSKGMSLPRLNKLSFYSDEHYVENTLGSGIYGIGQLICLMSIAIQKNAKTKYIYNYSQERDVLLDFTKKVLNQLNACATFIKMRFHKVNNDPEYRICRKRLMESFETLVTLETLITT